MKKNCVRIQTLTKDSAQAGAGAVDLLALSDDELLAEVHRIRTTIAAYRQYAERLIAELRAA